MNIYKIEEKIEKLKTIFVSDKKEKNRFLIIFISSLFFFDYILFCYHADKNPLNIFPSIPVMEDRKNIKVYLPDIDGINILQESRAISVINNKEEFIKFLLYEVINGSDFENTSVVIPVEIYIRCVWIYENLCMIDIVPSLLEKKTDVIPGSENSFKEAIRKTITENIPSIKEVILLDRGIPGRTLWEVHN